MAVERIEIVVTERGSAAAAAGISRIGTGARTAQSAVHLLNRTLGLIGVGAGILALRDLSDAATSLKNRLTVLNTGAQGVNGTLRALFDIANNAKAPIQELTEVYQRGSIAAKELGATQGELLQFTQAVADSLLISGTSASQARGALLQLGQALGTVTVRGQEFKSIQENLQFLLLIVAKNIDGMDGSVAKLRNRMLEGKLTSQEFFKAILAGSKELGELAEKTTPTLSQSFTVLRNKLVQMTLGLNDFTKAGQLASEVIITIANNLDLVLLALIGFAGLAVFSTITASLLQLGVIIGAVLNFATVGFVNLGRVMVLALVTPFRLIATLGSGAILVFSAIASTVAVLARTIGFLTLLALGSRTAVLSLIAGYRALGVAIAALSVGFLRLTASILTNPLFIGGVVLFAAIAAFVIFRKEIEALLPPLDSLKQVANDVFQAIASSATVLVAAFVAAFQTIVDKWRSFPQAIGDLVIQAVNGILSTVTDLINGTIDLLNKIPGIKLDKVTFEPLKNEFAGAAADIATTFNDHLNENINLFDVDVIAKVKEKFGEVRDFMKELVPDTKTREELEKLFKTLTDFVGGGDGTGAAGAAGAAGSGKSSRRKTFQDYLAELEREATLIGVSNREREQMERLIQIEDSLRRNLTATEREQALAIIEKIQANKEEREMLDELHGAQEALTTGQDTLNRLMDRGAITTEEYTTKLRQLRIDALSTARDMQSGFELGLLKIQEEFTNFGSIASETVTKTFSKIEDAFVELATTGKLNFKSLVDSILADITRMTVKMSITGPIANWLGQNAGGGGSFLSSFFSGNGQGSLGNLFGSVGSLLGFKTGGEFEVGGTGGPDSQIVGFRATPGERVKITPETKSGNDQRPIQVNMTVVTQDAGSFMKSQNQIMAKAYSAGSRAARRNN